MQVETRLYQRKGKAITNFPNTLPALQSDVAHDILKDPSIFDFITTGEDTDDKPTIGIILCETKNKVTAEYALSDIRKPIGIASYQFTTSLPDELKDQLPDVKALEASLREVKKRVEG